MILLKFFSHLPFWSLYILSDLFAFIVEYILQYRRKMILRNLRNSFPGKPLSKLRKIRSLYYKNLTDVTLETFKLLSMSPEEINKRVKILNTDKVNIYYEKNISNIITTSHVCNWEWMLAICGIQLKATLDAVYQQIKNPFFDKLMIDIRSRFGSIPVEKNRVFRESLKKRDIPHILALVADQSPPLQKENVIWVRFLNQDTAFYTGIAKLAKSYNWPIIFLDMRRIRRGFYEIEVKDLCPDPENMEEEDILKAYAGLVEESIRRDPHCWLWSHNRWKRTKNESEAPMPITNN